MEPGGASEGVEEGLVQQNRLHGVQVQVADIHLQHLQTLEQVEEGHHLAGDDLEHDQLQVPHRLGQGFPPVKRAYVVPVITDGAVIQDKSIQHL